MFEEAAREHPVRLVQSDKLPTRLTVGRWWRDELATVGGAGNPVAVDLLGLLNERTRLVDEARCQSRPRSGGDLQELRIKLRYLPQAHRDIKLAFWNRGVADTSVSEETAARLFTCTDMV